MALADEMWPLPRRHEALTTILLCITDILPILRMILLWDHYGCGASVCCDVSASVTCDLGMALPKRAKHQSNPIQLAPLGWDGAGGLPDLRRSVVDSQ